MIEHYGPVLKACASVPEDARQDLLDDLLDVVRRFNAADDGTLVLRMDYLEVVATTRSAPARES